MARDGRPLSPGDARKEEQRVEKQVRQHRAKLAERAARNGSSRESDDEVTISDLLRVCQFVNPRREPFRGRPALVYDFEPRPGVRARGRVESWIRKLLGTVWIDESTELDCRPSPARADRGEPGGGSSCGGGVISGRTRLTLQSAHPQSESCVLAPGFSSGVGMVFRGSRPPEVICQSVSL